MNNFDNKNKFSKFNEEFFTVSFDYGTIDDGNITVLYNGCLPFFKLEDYGITNVYPGDQLYIEYVGDMYIEESYPGHVTGVTVKNIELVERIVDEVPKEVIERDNNGCIKKITNNENNLEYIILDEELNFIPLTEYKGNEVYLLQFNHFTGYVGNVAPICSYLAFDPKDILLNTKIIFGSYVSRKEEFEEFFREINLLARSYIVIDNYETYCTIYNKLPNNDIKIMSEKEANDFFEDNLIVLHRRNISGSTIVVPVKYYYDDGENIIKKKYINNIVEETQIMVFVGYCIDIIEIPRDIYGEVNRSFT